MLKIDEEAALGLSGPAPGRWTQRRAGFATLREVLGASGALGDARRNQRLGRVAALFGLANEPVTFVPRSADGGRKAS